MIWVLLVGPADHCQPLIHSRDLAEALEAVDVLCLFAPSLRIALYRWDATPGECVRVLLIEHGIRREELPELMPEVVQPPAEPTAAGSATVAAPAFGNRGKHHGEQCGTATVPRLPNDLRKVH